MNRLSASRDEPTADAVYSYHGRTCPRCNRSVYRVPRRVGDLVFSLFIPVHRYRCDSIGCNWEGNLRNKRHFPSIQCAAVILMTKDSTYVPINLPGASLGNRHH